MKGKIERKGKQRIPVMENKIYSNLIFQIASGKNYAQKIFETTKKPTSIIVRQLDILRKEGFVSSERKEDKSTFPMQRLTIYSVNWKKIIEEFVKYIRQNVDYVCSENARLGMNLDKYIKGFQVRVEQARDKNFENSLKENKLLYSFFEKYYSTIGELKENWTISTTFDFLSFFGDLNFVYSWGASHNFYNIENLLQFINSNEIISFPVWLRKEKKPMTEAEEFERFKKTRLFQMRIDKVQYERLVALASAEGYTTISQYIRSKILEPSVEGKLNRILNMLEQNKKNSQSHEADSS